MSEGTWRFLIFASVLIVMALLEALAPRRERQLSRWHRWLTNLTLGGAGSLVGRAMAALSIPLAAIATAIWAEQSGWGILNHTSLPAWFEILLGVIILDFAIYLQHVASHKVPILWRLHKVHHSDRDIDVTTAIRFHPIEIGLSMLWKILVVLLLGPAAFAVFLFEVILNASAMFNHANLKLPGGLDKWLRMLIVTPDMHRVHHSIIQIETDSNYGFNLSIWDRLCGTYIPQPTHGHEEMSIGLKEQQGPEPARLLWSLGFPFFKSNKNKSPNREKHSDQ